MPTIFTVCSVHSVVQIYRQEIFIAIAFGQTTSIKQDQMHLSKLTI